VIGGCVGGGVIVLIIAIVAIKYSSHAKGRGAKAYDALDNDLTTNMSSLEPTNMDINDGGMSSPMYEDDDVEMP
jgi:hypothetical protein